MKTYTNPVYAYRRSADQDVPPLRRPVVVVGAGPVGLAAAILLADAGYDVALIAPDRPPADERTSALLVRSVYRETYDALKPQFGHWVIFDHCLPFDVSRAYDEATGHVHPRIWTAQRDKDMWQALEG
jgi:2-polyprenyl-6-methoxyphenol hydroxylase-like FAD-dependent oxidoreductase